MITILRAPARVLDWLKKHATITPAPLADITEALMISRIAVREYARELHKLGLITAVDATNGRPFTYRPASPMPAYTVVGRNPIGHQPASRDRLRRLEKQRRARRREREKLMREAATLHGADGMCDFFAHVWVPAGQWQVERVPGPACVFSAARSGLRVQMTPRR